MTVLTRLPLPQSPRVIIRSRSMCVVNPFKEVPLTYRFDQVFLQFLHSSFHDLPVMLPKLVYVTLNAFPLLFMNIFAFRQPFELVRPNDVMLHT